ncbi:unnamed protein product, partial [Polarella glacialis]
LIREARLRNPDLVVYALLWGLPYWVGVENGTQSHFHSEDTLVYLVSWLECAQNFKLGTINYLGNRNERDWGPTEWTTALRDALDLGGFTSTRLVLLDGEYDPRVVDLARLPSRSVGGDPLVAIASLQKNFSLAASGGAVALHAPCYLPRPEVRAETGLPLWSSQDGPLSDDWAGASCLGRVLNQNFVRMNVTSTLARTLSWSVHPALGGVPAGLVRAQEPWSGIFSVRLPLWMIAHTTQFTRVGWSVLDVQSGASGYLPRGGSFVSYASPARDQFTVVVEKLELACPTCAGQTTFSERLVFVVANLGQRNMSTAPLSAAAAAAESRNASDRSENQSDTSNVSKASAAAAEVQEITYLGFWLTNITHQFLRLPDLPIDPDSSSFNFTALPDTLYTISSLRYEESNVSSASVDNINTSADDGLAAVPFPVPLAETFDGYLDGASARYFADYGGSFHAAPDPTIEGNMVLKQSVTKRAGANQWAPDSEPISLVGHKMEDVRITVDLYLPQQRPSSEIFTASSVIQSAWSGLCLASDRQKAWDGVRVAQEACEEAWQTQFSFEPSTGRLLSRRIADDACVTAYECPREREGEFALCLRPCGRTRLQSSNQSWTMSADGTLRLAAVPDLCLTLAKTEAAGLALAPCASQHKAPPEQRWLTPGPELTMYAGVCLRLRPDTNAEEAVAPLSGRSGRLGYCLRLGVDGSGRGAWRLESGGRGDTLAWGPLPAALGAWHRISLAPWQKLVVSCLLLVVL